MLGLDASICRSGKELNFRAWSLETEQSESVNHANAVRGLADPRVRPEDDDSEKMLPSRMHNITPTGLAIIQRAGFR
jgi:hypothetical protein